jgi:hypothetical protein
MNSNFAAWSVTTRSEGRRTFRRVDHGRQITTNDEAFLVIPAAAVIQRNDLDTSVRRYDEHEC